MTENSELSSSSQPPPLISDTDRGLSRLGLILGFGILLLGAAGVIVVLPRLSGQPTGPEAVPARDNSAPLEHALDAEAALSLEEVREVHQRALKLQARLENQGVTIWGADVLVTSYGQAQASLAEADLALDEERVDQALEGYREALAQLEQLDASRPERLQRFNEMGDEAFGQLDAALAIQRYQTALSVDPADARAQAGLQRATNLPQVLSWISLGQIHEREQELDLARPLYEKAVALDKNFQPALDRLNRVEALILERDHRQALSEVLFALEQENTEKAREWIEVLRKLRPGQNAEIDDLELQRQNIERRINLDLLRHEGMAHEQAEEWELAIEVYVNALKLDEHSSFALVGKARAEEALALNHQVQEYLSEPDKLSQIQHRRFARDIHQAAIARNDMAPKLSEKMRRLGQLLDLYSKPVSVEFISDGLTQVRVIRVGDLGRFSHHRMDLLPGTYEFLGIRSGYRDVRESFKVHCVGRETHSVTVICKDKI